MCRIRAHCVVRKKGWVLTSEAPARAPRRRFSSLMRSLRMRDLQRLGWGLVGYLLGGFDGVGSLL